MIFKSKVVSCCALVLGLTFALYGQSSKPGEETTMTGCLTKGTGDAQYVLTEVKTGAQVTVTGPADLQKHASNHTVKLTGTTTTEADKTVFQATKVEHISAECQARPVETK